MPTHKKATDEQLMDAYRETKSVWKVAEMFSMCGQSVHERLSKLGVVEGKPDFTPDEMERLGREYVIYRDANKLQELADDMGRSKTAICTKARTLGLTDRRYPKTSRKFWEKLSDDAARSLMQEYSRSRLSIRGFAAKKGFGYVKFGQEMARRFPGEWDAHVEAHAPKQSMYRLGRALEYRVRDELKAKGYFVMRAPQSKGPVDLVAIQEGEVLFIQCKRGMTVTPKEWNALLDLALSVGAVPLVAGCPTGRGRVYRKILAHKIPNVRKTPWEDWTP